MREKQIEEMANIMKSAKITEEKRKAIQRECAKYDDCDKCPHTDGFCNYYSTVRASPEIIDEWHEEMFGNEKGSEKR